MISLFTYGSLMFSDIMFKVANCQPECTEAVLKDFFCSKIHGEEYPGILFHPGAKVTGILYWHLPPEAIRRLDAFEGEKYIRQDVEVIGENIGQTRAMTYVIKPECSHFLTGEAWSSSQFLSAGKAKFERAYFGFKSI